MKIYLGKSTEKNLRVTHSFTDEQSDLSIFGLKGYGKSNLLYNIAEQVRTYGRTVLLDYGNVVGMKGEILHPDIEIITGVQDIRKFLLKIDSLKNATLLFDEFSNLIRGKRKDDIKEIIYQILTVKRNDNIRVVFCTHFPDYRSLMSDYTCTHLFTSSIYFRLPVNTVNCRYDCSNLQMGECVVTSPDLIEHYRKEGKNKTAIKIKTEKYVSQANNLQRELKDIFGDVGLRIASIKEPSQYRIRQLGLGAEKSKLAMSIIQKHSVSNLPNDTQNLSV